jgi:hypothetical protein
MLLGIVGTLILLPVVLVPSIIGLFVGGVVLFVPIVLLGRSSGARVAVRATASSAV